MNSETLTLSSWWERWLNMASIITFLRDSPEQAAAYEKRFRNGPSCEKLIPWACLVSTNTEAEESTSSSTRRLLTLRFPVVDEIRLADQWETCPRRTSGSVHRTCRIALSSMGRIALLGVGIYWRPWRRWIPGGYQVRQQLHYYNHYRANDVQISDSHARGE